MAERLVIFDANSLLKLMTHYGEGVVPLDAELIAAGVSQYLTQWIGLEVRSKSWPGEGSERVADGDGLWPIHFRYEGKKVLTWKDQHQEPSWIGGVEGPKQI